MNHALRKKLFICIENNILLHVAAFSNILADKTYNNYTLLKKMKK